MPLSQIMVENEVGRLLPAFTSKPQPLCLPGRIVHNRSQPEHPWPFIAAPTLNQTGAAHVQFHCGPLHCQRSTSQGTQLLSSTSLSVLSSMVHTMHCSEIKSTAVSTIISITAQQNTLHIFQMGLELFLS